MGHGIYPTYNLLPITLNLQIDNLAQRRHVLLVISFVDNIFYLFLVGGAL